MSNLYLANAFSLSMLLSEKESIVKIKRISAAQAEILLKEKHFISAVGHASTAEILQELLFLEVPVNRVAIQLQPGDKVVVFQLKTRLPEGKVLSKEEISSLDWDFFLVELL